MSIVIRSSRPMTIDEIEQMATRGDSLRLKRGEECQGIYPPDHPFHEPCTGVHSHNRPRSEWCPRTRALDRHWDDSWERSTYKYQWFLRQSAARDVEQFNQLSDEMEAMGFPPTERLTFDADYWDRTRRSGASKPLQDRMREQLEEIAQMHLGHS